MKDKSWEINYSVALVNGDVIETGYRGELEAFVVERPNIYSALKAAEDVIREDLKNHPEWSDFRIWGADILDEDVF